MKHKGMSKEIKGAERAKNLMEAEAWLEHLEDEMEPMAFDADLELLLKNSDDDRALFESLKKTREAVKRSDDVALPESGHYYDNLHAKIMSAIEAEEASETPRILIKRSRRPFAWPTVFGAVGMTMMLAIISIMTLKTTSTNHAPLAAIEAADAEAHFERRLAMVDPRASAAIAHELGSFESEEDFLTETAAARLKQISAGEASAIFATLSR